jgi:hypothetical protein
MEAFMRRAVLAIVSVVLTSVVVAAVLPPPATSPRPFFVGVWSFDGSCASGDGMILSQDGKASYDEHGDGLWAVADNGQRLVLIVEDLSEEADRKTEAELVEFRVMQRAADGNAMTLKRLADGATITAKRCPR